MLERFRIGLENINLYGAMEVLCDELFDKARLPMYIDTWDEIAWSIAMKEAAQLPWILKLVSRRYGKSKHDWTRVYAVLFLFSTQVFLMTKSRFMNAINLMPYPGWYAEAEKFLEGSAFDKNISRPLALPLLVLNFELNPKRGPLSAYLTTTPTALKVFLDMILEDQYNKLDLYLRSVLLKLKCPSSFPRDSERIIQTEFWKQFGDLLERNFSRSELPVMQIFVKEYRDQLAGGLVATPPW